VASSEHIGGALLNEILIVADHGRQGYVDANIGLALDVAEGVGVDGAREGRLEAKVVLNKGRTGSPY
jgi:hypothetical protein